MFADDITLVREMATKYDARGPFVDVGGLEAPCIADYQITIDAFNKLRDEWFLNHDDAYAMELSPDDVRAAQTARYKNIHRPLGFLGDYICENPETGGVPISMLEGKYGATIGTAILLSVLEHVANPFEAAKQLGTAMAAGGLAIVSVPFIFPFHPSPEDNYRFTPTGLRHVFEDNGWWEVLEADWRLDIPADAGILDIKAGRPQAVQSCYLVARAR